VSFFVALTQLELTLQNAPQLEQLVNHLVQWQLQQHRLHVAPHNTSQATARCQVLSLQNKAGENRTKDPSVNLLWQTMRAWLAIVCSNVAAMPLCTHCCTPKQAAFASGD
jgi:hypothetical protein